jgi:molybdenum cofactor cytidylyltransferase
MEEHRRAGAPLVVPTFAERRGHPVIWGSSLFKELLENPVATREGARAVLHDHEREIVTVPVDDPAVVDQVNTPEDYERLVREWNREFGRAFNLSAISRLTDG